MRTGFLDAPRLRKARTAQTVRALKARAQPGGFRRVFGRFRITPGCIMSHRHGSEPKRHHRIEGTESDRLFRMLDRLAILSGESEAVAEMCVSGGGIRIETDCSPECRDRFPGAPFPHRPVAERDVPPRVAIVEHDRLHGMFTVGG